MTLLDEYDLAQIDPNELLELNGFEQLPEPAVLPESTNAQTSSSSGHQTFSSDLPAQREVSTLQSTILRSLFSDLLRPVNIETEGFKAYLVKNNIHDAKISIERALARNAMGDLLISLKNGRTPDKILIDTLTQMRLEQPLAEISQKLDILSSKENFKQYLTAKGIPKSMQENIINAMLQTLLRTIYLETGGQFYLIPEWLVDEQMQLTQAENLRLAFLERRFLQDPADITSEERQRRRSEDEQEFNKEYPEVQERLNSPIFAVKLSNLIDYDMTNGYPLQIHAGNVTHLVERIDEELPFSIRLDLSEGLSAIPNINPNEIFALNLSLSKASLSPNLFKNFNNVKSLIINSIKELPADAFTGLDNLEKLSLILVPESIHSITKEAFNGIPNLQRLWLLSNHNLVDIPDGTFSNLHHLTSVTFQETGITDPQKRERITQEIKTASPEANVEWRD